MTTVESHRKVLFVDDDRAFLDTMRRVMGTLSQGSWEILGAETTAHAFATLQEQPIHLVVIDVQMPVMDGLQFLTLLNRRHPNLQKVILTGYAASEAYRATCLSNGAELFLEKPKTGAAHETLFATLNELIKWQPEEGFRGVLRRVGLQDVLQMECLSRNSSVLEVKTRRRQGRIFIRDGQIVHAAFGQERGAPAFNAMLALKGGEFVLKPFTEPGEQTLEGSWEFLLMEAARMRDEGGSTGEDIGDEAVGEGAPSEGEVGLAYPAESGLAGRGAAAGGKPAALSGTLAAGRSGEVGRASAAPAGARRIEEVLVCSAQGEVVYDFQCLNSDLWINFFEFLSQKSRRLAQGLLLGEFDRLEVVGPGTRLVAILSPRRGILMRSRRDPRPATLDSQG
jgi:CheY-like chemotaxis protein